MVNPPPKYHILPLLFHWFEFVNMSIFGSWCDQSLWKRGLLEEKARFWFTLLEKTVVVSPLLLLVAAVIFVVMVLAVDLWHLTQHRPIKWFLLSLHWNVDPGLIQIYWNQESNKCIIAPGELPLPQLLQTRNSGHFLKVYNVYVSLSSHEKHQNLWIYVSFEVSKYVSTTQVCAHTSTWTRNISTCMLLHHFLIPINFDN